MARLIHKVNRVIVNVDEGTAANLSSDWVAYDEAGESAVQEPAEQPAPEPDLESETEPESQPDGEGEEATEPEPEPESEQEPAPAAAAKPVRRGGRRTN